MKIGRVILLIILVALMLVGLLHPLLDFGSSSASTSPDPVTVQNYTAQYDVAATGELKATETLTARFPAGRHGIFRFWDLADPRNKGVRYTPAIESVTMDGKPVPYSLSTQEGGQFEVAKIGDPDRYVTPGVHRYTIAYTQPDVISPYSAGPVPAFATTEGVNEKTPQSVFWWNVVAQGWAMNIESALITVNLPAPSEQVQCSVGTSGANKAGRACRVDGAGTNKLTIAAQDLPPRTGVTVRAAMPTPAPAVKTLPWSIAWDSILGRNTVLVGVVGLLALLAGFGGFLWARKSKETPPGLPVMYAPPQGLGPVQCVYITREECGSHSLAASLFHLADKGLIQLQEQGGKWYVNSTDYVGRTDLVDPVTYSALAPLGLTAPGQWFIAERNATAGKALNTAKSSVSDQAKSWARTNGFMVTSGNEMAGCALWILSLVLAGVLFFANFGQPTMWGLIPSFFVLGGLGLMGTGVGTRRTPQGRAVWSQAGGFERMLSTPSSEQRFDFSARKDLFIPYVPFAIAFGVAEAWAAKYRTEMGTDPPMPYWLPVYVAGYGGFSTASFDSFDSALSSSISAYQATQSSSGGGGGGGGSGGGGGGGGSW